MHSASTIELSKRSSACASFEQALAIQCHIGEPYEVARTLLAYGIVRRRAKQRRAARDLLSEALARFEALRATLWAERAREELGRAGGIHGRTDALTPTERRVAERVAAGLANKAVASELFLSVKAVEANLSRVYRKLGVNSRTQLATRLREPRR